ncbi:MAG TPA: hypothetical protein ENG13_06305 [bacterium]|nr:hypothetical protein [bacterium]HEX68657.1 hypothetical protein [bacterium]
MGKYFVKAGKENTEETLKLAVEEAKKRGINYLVVASTTGETGIKAVEMAKGTGIKVIIVTHNYGFKEEGKLEMSQEIREKIEANGGKVYTGTMVLRGLGGALKKTAGYSEELIVADTLRIFGQGMKVCVEMAAMVSDAGLVPPGDIIAVAGTGRGADTAVIIRATSSNRFFEIKVREIIAKPYDF